MAKHSVSGGLTIGHGSGVLFGESITTFGKRQKDLNIVYDTLRDVEDSNKFSIQSLDANCKFHWTPGIYDILELEPQESDEHENIILNCLDDNVRKEIVNTANRVLEIAKENKDS